LDRELSIIAQNAGTTAASLIGKFYPDELTVDMLDEFLGTYDVIRAHVFNGTIELAGVELVKQTFPGAVEVQAPVAPAEPFPVAEAQIIPHPSTQQAPPPPPAPQQNTGATPICPKCGGEMWDNRGDNNRRRAGGFKLSNDFKCRDKACGGVIWPADYQRFAKNPPEPR